MVVTVRRGGVFLVALCLGLGAAGCASVGEGQQQTPSAGAEEGVALGWTVEPLAAAELGVGWEARELPDAAAGLVDGLCGVPDVLEPFPPEAVVRFEGEGGVVTHGLVETDDAAGLATVLVTEIELCVQEDERVRAVERIEPEVDLPPSDAYRIEAYEGLMDLTSDAVWIVTTVDDTKVSIVGASTTDLFSDPVDPLDLAMRTAAAVHERRGASAS